MVDMLMLVGLIHAVELESVWPFVDHLSSCCGLRSRLVLRIFRFASIRRGARLMASPKFYIGFRV